MMIGSLSDMGLSSAARRFIPEYTERGQLAHLRGFLPAPAGSPLRSPSRSAARAR
jgi:O-antigen/teichoic acid export membrane protein